MADKRQVELDMLARDLASRELNNVGDSARRAGDGMKKMESDAQNLDRRILESRQHIQQLARDYAGASDDIERNSILKKLRAEQTQLRKDLKIKDLLPNPGEMRKAGTVAGASAGQGIMSGLADTLRAGGPVGTAFAVGIGTQVAAVAAPFIAATISGAILAGVGAGTIGLGAMLLKEDGRVKAAAGHLGSTAKSAFTDAARPMVGPLVDAIDTLEGSTKRLAPQMEKMFAGAAPGIAKLTRGLTGLAENALPGLTDAAGASDDAMSGLEQSLPQLGADIGTFFHSISEGSDGAAQGISDLVTGVGTLVRVTGYGIEGLSKMYGAARDFEPPQWMKDATTALLPLTPLLEEGAKKLGEWWHNGDNAAAATENLAVAVDTSGAAALYAAQHYQDYVNALNTGTDSNISAEQANIRLEEAIDRATAAGKRNNDGIDANTEKGRANRTALIGIAEAANTSYDAILKQTGSTELATSATDRGRRKFLEAAHAMGVSAGDAKHLADMLFRIPPARNVTVSANTKPALDAAEAIVRRINNMKARIGVGAYGSGSFGGSAHTGFGYSTGLSEGGLFRGAGTTTSDSNLVPVSDREFVVKAASTARPGVLPLLEWINNGARGSAPALPQAPASSARPVAQATPALTEDGIFRAMMRALRAMPVTRFPDYGRQAELYARGG